VKSLRQEITQHNNRYKIKKNIALAKTLHNRVSVEIQNLVDDATFFKHQIFRKIRDEYKTLSNNHTN
jgi:hypothetical protein